MKALMQEAYGSADGLKLREIDMPAARDDRVLVRVQAAGVDAGVWHVMRGLPYLIRPAFGLRKPRNPVLGRDVAGRVEAVGRDVTGFEPGDEVYGVAEGTFAELASARPGKLTAKPSNLSAEQAAAVPISAITALQAIRDQAKVLPGQKVLITGAGGGVGSFAVQIAKAFGAHVTGVCSTKKVDLVRSLGADEVIDYTREDFTQAGARWDVIIDTGGSRRLSHLRRVLTTNGTLVIVGGEGAGRWLGGVERSFGAMLLSPFVRQRLRMFVAKETAEDLRALTELIEAGKVIPAIDRTYPLEEAPDAIRYLEDGHARGKVVITVDGH
jgi:NADPH:quinone reductase-like Zn-dependent oxidoreductase